MLFPRQAGIRALGVLFNAEIFPDRSALRSETWIFGGDLASRASDAEIFAVQGRDRQALAGRYVAPISFLLTRQPRAVPVYSQTILTTAREAATLPEWLSVAGNYLGIIGVAGLIDVAGAAAAKIALTRST